MKRGITLETARLLREKGFGGPLFEYGSPDTPTCTRQDATDWLREEKGISIDVITDWEWTRDPMPMSPSDLETPDISEFTGYYYEIHQLRPHRLLYDSPLVSKDHAETEELAIRKALEFLRDRSE